MLADAVREARRRKGWSVLRLSRRSGVPSPVIRRIEGGGPSFVPSEGNTALLAGALRVPVGPLLAERDRLVERLRPEAASLGAAP
jgi:transcriptional regulator with XRE-family HTH domain